ncbi:hypothetical protein M3Y94_00438300 [Aphelenchoides besseyi]|nr:hypothetical protein M3Y94_00438300 [Aphelenchoides besseyi]KAI6229420.1 hypothetical protein M3Y95_00529200 [Aphelenchoides besseyi]
MRSILWPICVLLMFAFVAWNVGYSRSNRVFDFTPYEPNKIWEANFRGPQFITFELNNWHHFDFMIRTLNKFDRGNSILEPLQYSGYTINFGPNCAIHVMTRNNEFRSYITSHENSLDWPDDFFNEHDTYAYFHVHHGKIIRIDGGENRTNITEDEIAEIRQDTYCSSFDFDYVTLFTTRFSVDVFSFQDPRNPVTLSFYNMNDENFWIREYSPLEDDGQAPYVPPPLTETSTTVQLVEQTTTELPTKAIELPWCQEKDVANGGDRLVEWPLVWIGPMFFVHFVL